MRLLFLILLFIPLCAQGILEEAIAEAYTNFYAKYPLKVQAVQVSLASGSPAVLEQILKQTKKTQDLNLQWRTPQFLSQEGLLNLSLQNKSVWVKYKIKASIQVYKSKTMLRKDQNLDQSNTYQVSIPFTRFFAMPIDSSYINNSSARSFLAANTLLSIDKIGAQILVYKHEIFHATLKEGAISLETSLQALENGVLNQVIQALNVQSKKVVQVKITGFLKGEVL
ncbi:flagellar basal body P-ring formation chaperone FlgA [Helicobacter ailurogastricus]|uniref:Flagella basal body P-ring formation protein FlgA n=1 Tax=Helicobacter ailurogastricus TaxID=1578720 RepID=A0A0K2X3G5_9HELI|nr:flagellar basal body P-ring formation chaperone FlgA [Helicobacter ailurogastricus]BDQ29584.1 flagella basal body P-ring formation protein FlgA [Helicobacter ailurogastricus]GMB89918.1 Flagellar basal body P-ring biosynthesis protein FlgA [Helicobacter ailurogastricus]CRF41555.1 flagellar basal body P-ring biosynthesis protein [Helicobacter ailurogastricus]CRF44940.1 flagellar basal body P-ring biosynthesis protein [Helicobacter ailurogastricus]